MKCPYCGNVVELIKRGFYKRPDLRDKPRWVCKPCGAHVGCHPGTFVPLGTLANAELRAARHAAHTAFDPLWKEGNISRSQAYAWLSRKLRITVRECHIGYSSVEQCRRIVALCEISRVSP